uniref:Uncharacterized protein n=1 Tax=Anguilla anguilla TaxID=7936 RepID=A0A0E9Q0F8_ANGAN
MIKSKYNVIILLYKHLHPAPHQQSFMFHKQHSLK